MNKTLKLTGLAVLFAAVGYGSILLLNKLPELSNGQYGAYGLVTLVLLIGITATFIEIFEND